MKSHQRNELHLKHVNLWLKANSELSSEQLVHLLISGIQAIRQKSLGTLSGVTVNAVAERALFECKEKSLVLASITCDAQGLDFRQFILETRNLQHDETVAALKDFLLELLDVLGKITAEILTKYLHQELITVTPEAMVRTLGITKKNREQT